MTPREDGADTDSSSDESIDLVVSDGSPGGYLGPRSPRAVSATTAASRGHLLISRTLLIGLTLYAVLLTLITLHNAIRPALDTSGAEAARTALLFTATDPSPISAATAFSASSPPPPATSAITLTTTSMNRTGMIDSPPAAPTSLFEFNTAPRTRTAETPFRYEFTIAAMFSHDEPRIIEWIEYHLLLGAQHFWLFEHFQQYDAGKSLLPLLRPYIDLGLVSYEWAQQDTKKIPKPRLQVQLYKQTLERARGVARWVAFIDTDEYIYPHTHDNLTDLFRIYDDAAGVVLHWQMFGTSRVKRLDESDVMIEHLRWKGKALEEPENKGVKTAVQPLRISAPAWHPHAFHPIAPYFLVETNGVRTKQSVPLGGTEAVHIAHVQLNHYFTRDERFLRRTKFSWRISDKGPLWSRRLANWHSELDTGIQRFVPELRRRLGLAPRAPTDQHLFDLERNATPMPYSREDIARLARACPKPGAKVSAEQARIDAYTCNDPPPPTPVVASSTAAAKPAPITASKATLAPASASASAPKPAPAAAAAPAPSAALASKAASAAPAPASAAALVNSTVTHS